MFWLEIRKITHKLISRRRRETSRSAKRAIQHAAKLAAHPLFDASFYTKEVGSAGLSISPMAPALHYVKIGDALRLRPHPLFDAHFYHEMYPDIEGSGMSALFHYIEHGAIEGRTPHPAFDPSYVRDQIGDVSNPLLVYIESAPGNISPHRLFDEKKVLLQLTGGIGKGKTVLETYFEASYEIEPSNAFDAREYAKRYPDIGNLHPYYHYIRWGKNEGRLAFGRSMSLRGVADAIEAVADLDPSVLPPHLDFEKLGRISRTAVVSTAESMLDRILHPIDLSRTTYIFIINSLVAGGAERVVANFCKAQQNEVEIAQILILVTGRGRGSEAQAWISAGKCRIVDIADLVEFLDANEAALTLGIFLQLLPLQGVCVVNSALGWRLIERHGLAIREICTLAACAFCYDYDNFGRRAGYAWTHLPYCIDLLDVIITDNNTFAGVLSRDLRLSSTQAERIKVLYQPTPLPEVPPLVSFAAAAGPPRILWASRFSSQKRVRLALEVARLVDQAQFVFAGGDVDDVALPEEGLPSNVVIYGRFQTFEELPLATCTAFLYTAAWDGLPNILLEAGAAGLPIIAPDVGGISELVGDATGWQVKNHNDPESYADALLDCLASPAEAQVRAARLLAIIRERHDPKRFDKSVSILMRGKP